MATSGSYDFSVTASEVMTEAAETIGILEAGESLTSNDSTSMLRTLNMLVKQWSANFDFAPGFKAFQRKRGYVFLQADTSVYNLGPSGDNASLAYVSTTMRIAGISTDTTLQVTSTTGMTAADKIGIELDSGSIYWTTIASVTDGDTLVISAGLTGGAAIGNRIFTYTTKLIRPLIIENVMRRDVSSNDYLMDPFTIDDYERITVKGNDGTPSSWAYENTLVNGKLYIDIEPQTVTDVLRLTFIAPAEDYDSTANDIAYPQEWFLPLALGLAKLSATKFGVTWGDLHESNYIEALRNARSSYAETTELYFESGCD